MSHPGIFCENQAYSQLKDNRLGVSIFSTTLAYNSLAKFVLIMNPSISNTMSELKTQVLQLFEKDKELNALEKEIKVKNAHYHHLILKKYREGL